MKVKKDYPTYKTLKQWATEGFFINEDAQGTELWTNCYHKKKCVYYSPDEVHKAEPSQLQEYFAPEKQKKKLREQKRRELKQAERERERIQKEQEEIYKSERNNRRYIKNAILPCITELSRFYAKEEPTPSGIIVLDVETTGLNPQLDEILQLSIIDGFGTELYNKYFNPCAESWSEAQAINHISPIYVQNKSRISWEIPTISTILAKAHTIIGYSHLFDITILKESGVIIPQTAKLVDVAEMFAHICGEWNERFENYNFKKLTDAANYYGYKWEGAAHDSLADCKATLFVYNKITGKAKR